MADCELLERAAAAAGLNLYKFGGRLYTHYVDERDACADWNPLTDDGDALRLAVKLGTHITNSATDAWASTLLVTAIEPIGNDPCAATRRAIVRAAAALPIPHRAHNEI